MIEITPQISKTSYCVLSCIKCYLSHLGAPYEAMLLCNWSMGPIIENVITLPYSISPLTVLADFTGTQISGIEKNKVQYNDIYKELNQNKPVITYVDSYDCKWMTYYHKIHADHYILLTGYNENLFYSLDPYLVKSVNIMAHESIINVLQIDNLENHYLEKFNEKIFIFNKIGYNSFNPMEVVKIAAKKYRDIYHYYMENLQVFFNNSSTIYKLLNENYIVHNKFYFELKSIVDSRIDFFVGIQYIYHKFSQELINIDILMEFEEIVQLWKKFLSCLYRFPYAHSIEKKKTIILRGQKYFNDLVLMENEFSRKLLQR